RTKSLGDGFRLGDAGNLGGGDQLALRLGSADGVQPRRRVELTDANRRVRVLERRGLEMIATRESLGEVFVEHRWSSRAHRNGLGRQSWLHLIGNVLHTAARDAQHLTRID